jgi:hypothetical protein
METSLHHIERLREAVEKTVGCKILTHKDFMSLSEAIYEQTNQTIGVNTLKRIWGSIEDSATPRPSTLNILAQYAGAESWEAFCNAENYPPHSSDSHQETPDASHDVPQAPQKKYIPFSSWKSLILPAFIVLVTFALVGTGMYVHSMRQQVSLLQDSIQGIQNEKYMLRCGRTFTSYDDYLDLFGLKGAKEYPYFQIHPHYSWLVLWGPQYHHPHWQNDGDSARLMPTITERWTTDSAAPELIALRNSELFYNGRRNNDIRLTFMKGLRSDSLFTFIGVYRFSMSESDTTHIVWEKVADECDLQHLELLERLRN